MDLHITRYRSSFSRVVKETGGSWKTVQWQPWFTQKSQRISTRMSTVLTVCGLNLVREFGQRCSVILSIEIRHSNCRPLLDGVNGILPTFSTMFARLHTVRYKEVSTELYWVIVRFVIIRAVKTIFDVYGSLSNCAFRDNRGSENHIWLLWFLEQLCVSW